MTRRVAALALPLIVSLAASGIGAALLWSVRDELPTRIATHWNARGQADDFMSLDAVLVWGIASPIVMALFMAGLGVVMKQQAALGGAAAGTAVFTAGIMLGSAYSQRGLAEGESAPLSNSLFLIPILLGLVIGIGVGLLLRRRTDGGVASGPLPADAPRLGLGTSHDTASWSGELRRGRTGPTILATSALVIFVVGIVLWVYSGVWVVTLVAVLLLAVVPLLYADVTIDRRGVRVVALGIALKTVPLNEVQYARVVNVSCMGDYGGYGYRGGFDGSWGYVTADGEGIRIEQSDDRALVLTIDDARTAAATLNTLAEAVRQP